MVREFFGALAPTGRALLLNQSGSHAGDGLSAMPVGEDTRARRFLTTLRRRAWLPLGLGEAECPGCGVPLDPCGIHLTSCPDSGRVRSRAAPLERAFMGIAREAGGRCRWQPLVRTLILLARWRTGFRALRGSLHRQMQLLALRQLAKLSPLPRVLIVSI